MSNGDKGGPRVLTVFGSVRVWLGVAIAILIAIAFSYRDFIFRVQLDWGLFLRVFGVFLFFLFITSFLPKRSPQSVPVHFVFIALCVSFSIIVFLMERAASGAAEGAAPITTIDAVNLAFDQTLRVNTLSPSQAWCEAPDGIMDQEGTFLLLLQRASQMAISAGQLTVFDSNGNRILEFVNG